MLICALSHTLPEGLWAVMPNIGVNQGKFCIVSVRVCEITKAGVLRWGTGMDAHPEAWLEKGGKIEIAVPLDLCLSNIFQSKEDAADKAKVPAASRGRRSASPMSVPGPTLVTIPTMVGISAACRDVPRSDDATAPMPDTEAGKQESVSSATPTSGVEGALLQQHDGPQDLLQRPDESAEMMEDDGASRDDVL